MWDHLPTEALLCGVAGCVRAFGHAGCHTATPNPATHAWDHDHEAAQALALLDWPTPHFGTALDPID